MPEGALTSFTGCDAYRYFAGQTLSMTSQSRPRTEYLLPTDNIIVRDWYFILTKKSNLVARLYCDLIRILDNFVVAFIFGPPCICIQNTSYGLCTVSWYQHNPSFPYSWHSQCPWYCHCLAKYLSWRHQHVGLLGGDRDFTVEHYQSDETIESARFVLNDIIFWISRLRESGTPDKY